MSGKGRPAVGAAGGGSSGGGMPTAHSYSTLLAPPRQAPHHGRIVGDVWYKTVRDSIHRLRVPPAFACDADDLTAAEEAGVEFLHLHDLESLRHYWTATSVIRAKGFRLDRGHGEQIALDLGWWRPSRVEAEALDEALRGPAPAARQLALFGGDL